MWIIISWSARRRHPELALSAPMMDSRPRHGASTRTRAKLDHVHAVLCTAEVQGARVTGTVAVLLFPYSPEGDRAAHRLLWTGLAAWRG
jgi:hypothetical protein